MSEQPVVIAFLDVLGSEDRMLAGRRPDPQLVRALEQLVEITDHRRDCLIIDGTVDAREMDDGSVVSGTALAVLVVEVDRFTDAAILWSIFDKARFWTFCDLLAECFCQIVHNGIPLRAGVAVGSAHMDTRLRVYVGRPLAEAVRVEKAQGWVGVSFGPSFAREPFSRLLKHEHVLRFAAHRKPGHSNWIPGIVLDWPRKWRAMYGTGPERKLAAMNVDPKHSTYYDLAIKFAEYSAGVETREG